MKLHEDQYKVLFISRSFLLGIRNFSDKRCRVTPNTHSTRIFNNLFFENRTVYEIFWKNIVQRGKPQMTIRRM